MSGFFLFLLTGLIYLCDMRVSESCFFKGSGKIQRTFQEFVHHSGLYKSRKNADIHTRTKTMLMKSSVSALIGREILRLFLLTCSGKLEKLRIWWIWQFFSFWIREAVHSEINGVLNLTSTRKIGIKVRENTDQKFIKRMRQKAGDSRALVGLCRLQEMGLKYWRILGKKER